MTVTVKGSDDDVEERIGDNEEQSVASALDPIMEATVECDSTEELAAHFHQ
jgi:hypothetical protein